MTAIVSNMQAVRHALEQAAQQAGRPAQDIVLMAVSKTFPAASVREAYAAGQRVFGESYVQEALDKIAALHDLSIEWHFIGPIQSNKTRAIAENFSWVHGIDRLKIAGRLSAQRPPHLPPLNVCIQVNVSGEHSKSGVAPGDVMQLAQQVARLPQIRLRGLMAIPAPAASMEVQRKPFALLRELQQQLNAQGMVLDTLSMGMSQDMAAAILEGATIVRVGSAIFGERDYSQN